MYIVYMYNPYNGCSLYLPLLGVSLNCCSFVACYHQPISLHSHTKKAPCKYLHRPILLMLASLTLYGHSQ